jgi:[ribosomal protein S18]-alanine N-acetyltransferase
MTEQQITTRSHAAPASLRLRYMRMEDVTRIYEIDQLSFSIPWTPKSYAYEINDNDTSHMIVLETIPDGQGRPRGLLDFLRRPLTPAPLIVGYGGVWIISGEAHVSTIATHPDWRRKGYGEILLNAMLRRALQLQSDYCVLEVRQSNLNAQALYRKYGFEVVGRRKGYYRDNNEDALLMHVGMIGNDYAAKFEVLSAALAARIPVENNLERDDPRGRTA